jgi:hypothetical protein
VESGRTGAPHTSDFAHWSHLKGTQPNPTNPRPPPPPNFLPSRILILSLCRFPPASAVRDHAFASLTPLSACLEKDGVGKATQGPVEGEACDHVGRGLADEKCPVRHGDGRPKEASHCWRGKPDCEACEGRGGPGLPQPRRSAIRRREWLSQMCFTPEFSESNVIVDPTARDGAAMQGLPPTPIYIDSPAMRWVSNDDGFHLVVPPNLLM